MLKVCRSINQLDFRQLMDIYEEMNENTGRDRYPKQPKNLQILFAEQDFYQYLEMFFRFPGAQYALWVQDGQYKAALRMEDHDDGLLITALEVPPASRGKGYATELLRAVQDYIGHSDKRPLYSHIEKQNAASLAVHKKCGFSVILQYAHFLDGTKHDDHNTLMWRI